MEESVNFGDIVVGSSASKELTIHNNSDCSLHYNLLIDQEITGPYDDEQNARDVLGKLLSWNLEALCPVMVDRVNSVETHIVITLLV